MIVAYDHEARSRQAFIDEARQKEEEERMRVTEKVNGLTAELDAYKKSAYDQGVHLQRVSLEKRELEAEVADLRSSREREIEAAVASARRTADAEVRTQLNQARELFGRMMNKPIQDVFYLSQAVANLQLLEDLEKAKAGEPFDLKAECVLLTEHKERLGGADENFDSLVAEMKKILGKNFVVPVNVADIVVSPRVEVSAKAIGVNVASGSNDGSLGLRLRDASEELNGSESGEEEKTPVPTTIVPTERREPASPLEEPQTGEVASLVAAEAPIEDREDEDEGEEESEHEEEDENEPAA